MLLPVSSPNSERRSTSLLIVLIALFEKYERTFGGAATQEEEGKLTVGGFAKLELAPRRGEDVEARFEGQ
ncbi:unnamed protein product [Dibothriocephalus latus]|uniref:Uncharacterized protein n=1 Tax=Dibothriocephalus latus TaxID=60516 RepID=A0A3P7NMA7_DIBLA|nr:unnamed protein product [Dibothriocephalus latus]